jgi:hypothetical protein
MITNTELKEIEDRIKKATNAPWVTDLHQGRWTVYCGEIDHYHPIALINQNQNQENNASFIAHARQDIIKCLNEIDRLKEVIRNITNGQPLEGGWN